MAVIALFVLISVIGIAWLTLDAIFEMAEDVF